MVKRVKRVKVSNGHGKPGHNSGILRLYRSYNNVDKNPAIDKLRTAMQDDGLDIKKLHLLSNVGETTIDNWFNGKTKNPQSVTLNAAAAAMGLDWVLKRDKKLDYDKEIPAAVRWHQRLETDRQQKK